ncbi:hypothetical protein AX14_011287 [Amanita brunnescens Koide BX004]|nr:hypothetical protein AX14_011287 [Amanita brunnescens Koide BX004]
MSELLTMAHGLASTFNLVSSSTIYLVKKKLEDRLLRMVGTAKSNKGRDETHWALMVDQKYYHLGVEDDGKTIYLNTVPFNKRDIVGSPKKVGSTKWTHRLIEIQANEIVQRMNAEGGYRLLSTNCQDFANRLFTHIDEEVTPTFSQRAEGIKDLFDADVRYR